MKNKTKFLKIAIGLLALTLLLVGCDTDRDSNNNGDKGDPKLPGTVTISVQGGGGAFVDATLVASYSGKETVTWQWSMGEEPIAEATEATYVANIAGLYTATASAKGFKNKTSNTINVTVPVFKTVSTGIRAEHSLAIKTDGTLWAWGTNGNRQLGLGDTTNRDVPTQVGTDKNWAFVSAGDLHSLAVKTNGTLWAWGNQANGRLGNGETSGDVTTPTQIGTDTNWAFVSTCRTYSLAVKTDGTRWAWGSQLTGRLGNGETSGDVTEPLKIGTDTNWASVSAGWNHALAIKTDGTLWAWGSNDSGPLGLGDTTDRTVPTPVGDATNWASVSSGSGFSLALRTNGELWAWGYNLYGQNGLGTDNTGNVTTPTQIPGNWASVSAGQSHSLAIKTDGTLWAWGNPANGRLGNGLISGNVTTPTQIGTDTNWASVSGCGAHSLAIKTDGTAWAWGNQLNGRLGNGENGAGNVTTPTQVLDE